MCRWEDLVAETSGAISSCDKSFAEVKTNKVRLNINATASGIARFYEIEVYGRIATLGTNDFSASKFSIYPNPTSNILNVSGDEAVSFLQVFDGNGKSLLIQKNSNSVDVSSLPTGVYFMKLNNKETVKFIKK